MAARLGRMGQDLARIVTAGAGPGPRTSFPAHAGTGMHSAMPKHMMGAVEGDGIHKAQVLLTRTEGWPGCLTPPAADATGQHDFGPRVGGDMERSRGPTKEGGEGTGPLRHYAMGAGGSTAPSLLVGTDHDGTR